MSEQEAKREIGEIREGLIALRDKANTEDAKSLLADAVNALVPDPRPADTEDPSAWIVVKRMGDDVVVIHWGGIPNDQTTKLELGEPVAAQVVYTVDYGGPDDDGRYLFGDWIDASRFRQVVDGRDGWGASPITEEVIHDALATDALIEGAKRPLDVDPEVRF